MNVSNFESHELIQSTHRNGWKAHLLILALALTLDYPVHGQMLVHFTNVWRYNQSNTPIATTWRQREYDDSSWSSGSGIFQAGYRGTGPETNLFRTKLSLTDSNGQPVITHLFRTHFAYQRSPAPVWLGLTNFIDDGVILYLNGVEVHRFNMPPGEPAYTTYALTPIDTATMQGVSFLATNLVQGDNLLCAELHKHDGTTADAVFGLQLAIAEAPYLTSQPLSVIIARSYDATFSVRTTNNLTPLAYQWWKEGIVIPGATNATYTVTAAQHSHAGFYSVRVANPLGSVNSLNASLTILPAYSFVTLAGLPGARGTNDGLGSNARFANPSGVTLDGTNGLYVVDQSNHTIRRITTDGAVTTIAGRAGILGHQDGSGSDALFNFPAQAIVGPEGNLLVADQSNHVIRKISPAGAVVTILGAPQQAGSQDGTNNTARLNNPRDLVMDSAGNIFLAGGSAHSISKINWDGTNWMMKKIAGGTGNQPGVVDGVNSAARFRYPTAIDLDRNGNLYVTDGVADTVRKIQPSGADWLVTTLAGSGNNHGIADGRGSVARFDSPYGIAVDRFGNVFVADTVNHIIRKIRPDGQVITIGGMPQISGSANGAGSQAGFNRPGGLAVDDLGNLYVADSGNHAIRIGWSEDTLPIVSLGTPTVSSDQVEIAVTVRTGSVLSLELWQAPTPVGPWTTNTSAISRQVIPGLPSVIIAPLAGATGFYKVSTR